MDRANVVRSCKRILMEALVRTPEPERPVEAPSVASVDISEQTPAKEVSAPTPEELVNLERPPYITDLLDAGLAYETFEVKSQLKEIDVYIREESNTREDYKKVFENLLTKIKETDDIYSKIEQIRDYIRIQNKIKEVVREKKEFEQKPPEDMTAAQLERYFKQNGLPRY